MPGYSHRKRNDMTSFFKKRGKPKARNGFPRLSLPSFVSCSLSFFRSSHTTESLEQAIHMSSCLCRYVVKSQV